MDVVYFADNGQAIKIGFSSQHSKRLAAHEIYGFETRAIVPATSDEEAALHKHFDRFRKNGKRGREMFEPTDEIYEYIAKLLYSGIATDREEDVQYLDVLPYSIWAPDRIQSFRQDNVGQLGLFPPLPPKERVQRFNKLVHLMSITDEWYTPEDIIVAAKGVMGGIDTDPATTPLVNRRWINARVLYTRTTNGLAADRPWNGRVWLNPPYGTGEYSASEFAKKLVREIERGNVTQVITCLNANSMTSIWFQTTIMRLFPVHCIYRGRINFVPPEGVSTQSSPSKGTVLSYWGNNVMAFREIFGKMGAIIKVE